MEDLRNFIKLVEEKAPGDIIYYQEEVDPYYEITAIQKKFDISGYKPLIVFEKVKGYPYKVVVNVETSLPRFSVAMNLPEEKVEENYAKVEEAVITGKISYPPREIAKEDSPVKEVIVSKDDVDLYKFPVVTHHVGETPYITRGIGVVRDPEEGYLHAAYYRLMIKDKNHMVTHVTPGRHLWYIYKKAEARGEALPIAFVVGNHPLWSLGAQSRIPHPPSEFDVIGGLLGKPLSVVRCEHSDLLVPARAELVIEGELRPDGLEKEGPWSDFTRYSQEAQRHSVYVKGITHRKDMYLHDSCWVQEGAILTRIPQNAFMLREIKKEVPSVKDFRFGLNPAVMYGIISMKKTHLGEPKQAIISAFAKELYLKFVIVVDDDIDFNNDNEIFWSIATRFQAERDLLIIPGIIGTDLDLSAVPEGYMTKVGIDATAKPFRKDLPKVGQISPEHLQKADISKYIKLLTSNE